MIILAVLITFTFSSSAFAQTCTGFQCPTGKRCEMQIESCPTPPCVPLPICIVNTTACVLPCPLGESCVWDTVLCKKEPCNPRPICKADQKGFPRSCEGIYCRRDMKCVQNRGVSFVPVCIKHPTSSDLPMGTMPPTVTCKTLGCQPGERCVKKEYGPQCEPVDCGSYAEYDRCFDGCEATCDNFGPLCGTKCGPGGCRCKTGYYRTPEGACIMECPRAFGG
ncbi:hypothetical protein PRIPAC_71359 [Pristionchus pacificus]|uniref:Uncharacterized protein n=1 Tax=Pristionchus pacificus TaxID=54126 RepID=A0A2A6CA09_PRIPA|nr:hypothetical protein PRIPAC_71359 [Pristionchus pacificus]|eukprot:PDM74908.1 hypothetical protein PRIPAC_40289 [Pristionchus pacificus]